MNKHANAPVPSPVTGDGALARDTAARGEASLPDAGEGSDAGLVAHLLGGARTPDGMGESRVVSWAKDCGMLDNGQTARLGASCLLRPAAGDRVLTWSMSNEGTFWVLAVLERADKENPAVLAAGAPKLSIEASTIALNGQAVHVVAGEFLSSTEHRHAVEGTRTEICKVRVSDVGTDIRRATAVNDRISGTFLQRAGTWLSTTVRDARFRAKAFLFE